MAQQLRERLRLARTRNPAGLARSFARRCGFTLLEMMIVITIMLILLSIGVGQYEVAITHSKEAALTTDLRLMRQAIQQYTVDKGQAPQALDDLVTAGYLRGIPVDPFTGLTDWQTNEDQVAWSPEQTSFGITDVHSASNLVSPLTKTPYSSW